MGIITVNAENLGQEHICCALAKNDDPTVVSKKEWLADRFDEGLVFLKGNVRGKCFIEYLPAELAWVPLDAPDCFHINCLWVSGRFKGQGWSNALLDRCIADAREQGKRGLTILSSQRKKQAFLADPSFLTYKGFTMCDTAEPYFALYYLPLDQESTEDPLPHFKASVSDHITNTKGYTLYYTNQCPFTVKYVPLIKAIAEEYQVPFEAIHLNTREKAQEAPSPFTTYSLYHQGKFVTNEILSEKKFENMILEDQTQE